MKRERNGHDGKYRDLVDSMVIYCGRVILGVACFFLVHFYNATISRLDTLRDQVQDLALHVAKHDEKLSAATAALVRVEKTEDARAGWFEEMRSSISQLFTRLENLEKARGQG